MESKKFWKFWIILAASLAGLVLVYATFRFIKQRKDQPEVPEQEDEEVNEGQIIVKHYNIIKEGLTKEGYQDEQFVRMITAQGIHESSYKGIPFDSPVMTENKNMFGMRQPMQRPTLSLGEKGSYASFASLEDSAQDQGMYFKYVSAPETFTTVDDFVKFLKSKSYYEDSVINYKNGVRSALAKVNMYLNN